MQKFLDDLWYDLNSKSNLMYNIILKLEEVKQQINPSMCYLWYNIL